MISRSLTLTLTLTPTLTFTPTLTLTLTPTSTPTLTLTHILTLPLTHTLTLTRYDLSVELKHDREADAAFGWVLEMWGWTLNAAQAGVRHKVIKTLQAEPGGPGIPFLDPYYIYHYTFDLAYRQWTWSKRTFMGNYPPRLDPPPQGSLSSSRTFVTMMNQAIDALQPWHAKRRELGGWT